MAWCLVMSAVCHTLEHSWKRRLLSQLPGYAGLFKNGDSPVWREVFNKRRPTVQKVRPGTAASCFNTASTDRWKDEKKANCFTLLKLRRITRLKCVNSEVKSNVGSTTWKGIPRRAHVILSNRHEWHTCLGQLFELLTWNVSFVQNKAEHLAKKGKTAAIYVLKWTEAHWLKNQVATCRFLAQPVAISEMQVRAICVQIAYHSKLGVSSLSGDSKNAHHSPAFLKFQSKCYRKVS